MKNTNKKIRNRGSAVIEVSLLIPFILGVVYLYITYFLFEISVAKKEALQAESLYVSESKKKLDRIEINEETKFYKVSYCVSKDDVDSIKSIRRWQLAVRAVS